MSHYTVTFTGTKAEKEAQAAEETKSYLGLGTYRRICRALEKDAANQRKAGHSAATIYRNICIAAPFAGIQGYYPVRNLARIALRASTKHN